MKKTISLILAAMLLLMGVSCEEETPFYYKSRDTVATGTNAPIIAAMDITAAFDDSFTSAYGDFTESIAYDMNHFNSVLGKNYHMVLHAVETNVTTDEVTADYFFGINRIDDDYCFELIYLTAVEFIKCGDGYAYFVTENGSSWSHDTTIRTSREHLKRIYNGLAYGIIAPYNEILSSLKQHPYSTKTYCDRVCTLYQASINGEGDDGVKYSYNGEFYIDESSGISMYTLVDRTQGDQSYNLVITCDELTIGDAKLDYKPNPSTYM